MTLMLMLVTVALAVCTNSKPCGNSCISTKYTCHKGTPVPEKVSTERYEYTLISADANLKSLSFSRNGILHTCSSELPDDLAIGAVITTNDIKGAGDVWVFTYSPTGGDDSTPTKWLNVSACSKVSQQTLNTKETQ